MTLYLLPRYKRINRAISFLPSVFFILIFLFCRFKVAPLTRGARCYPRYSLPMNPAFAGKVSGRAINPAPYLREWWISYVCSSGSALAAEIDWRNTIHGVAMLRLKSLLRMPSKERRTITKEQKTPSMRRQLKLEVLLRRMWGLRGSSMG